MRGHPAAVWGRFLRTALLWMVPAVILLPFLAILALAAMAAADGTILELGGWVRGRVMTALGPLLIVCGAAALAFAAVGRDPAVAVMIAGIGGLGVAAGVIVSRRALRRVAAEIRAR